MNTPDDDLTYREKELLSLIQAQNGRMMTSDIYRVANMAKATALKHLAVLEAKGLIRSEYIGPVKLWWICTHCPKCNAVMSPTFLLYCKTCRNHKTGE